MDNLIIGINKSYAIHNFEDIITPFCNALIKKNNMIEELQQQVKQENKARVSLARAYARKLGVLLTIKKYNKVFGVENNE